MSTIGLNAQLLNLAGSYRSAGIHRYIYHLLTELPGAAPHHRYVAFLNERQMVSAHPTLQTRYTRWPARRPLGRIIWEQTALPLATFTERLSLLHALAFVRPVIAACPVVITIYDLSFERMPERFPLFQRLYLRSLTRYSARRAARLITISESTKNDVVQFCGVPPDKVVVTYCGVDEPYRPLSTGEVERFRAEKGLPAHFILYLGTLEPRKNVANLVRAYAALPRNGPERPKLVIAGGKGWGYDDVFAAVEQTGVQSDVIWAGYVPQSELPLWYNSADLFVFPSWFEGFGLPVLEAMACGVPAITSNVSSLPEVAGDAALTVPPADTRALSEAMERALYDLPLRAQMRERGLRQAQSFSWKRTARQTADVYQQVLGD
ncbi:MAG: glycosyltransferase family 4 protein [Chloroflexi bacterium]|nr:glycosyltransferase family 4 protein [Chloroflexota bacterium]